ncbi:hypothetical protein [Nonomuraea sp. NPDC002799]
MRSKLIILLCTTLMAMLATVTGTGMAYAAGGDPETFIAQSRAAGLSETQAAGLQKKVDAYLAKLKDKGVQMSPNQIDLNGAVLNVTVPGESRPRQLGEVTTFEKNAFECIYRADPGWFCAYEFEYRTGDNIGMWRCGEYAITFYSVGSWENNQTAGTRPRLYFTNQSSWLMPAAYSIQPNGVAWEPVARIRNC